MVPRATKLGKASSFEGALNKEFSADSHLENFLWSVDSIDITQEGDFSIVTFKNIRVFVNTEKTTTGSGKLVDQFDEKDDKLTLNFYFGGIEQKFLN